MHLQEAILIAAVLDHAALSTADAAHLAACGECQARLAWWQETAQDLDIARASTPSGDVLAHYEALFSQVERASSHGWQRMVERVATLIWDGRNQPAGAGIRNSGATGYRLLYAVDPCEVELMVEPSGRTRVIEGAWMVEEETDSQTAVLVELFAVGAPAHSVATEAGKDGRFRLAGVSPGVYRMTLTPAAGPQVTIEPLVIG